MRCPAHTTNLSATPRRPACPSRASGWSLLTTLWGFPCCVRFPCVHAAATTPAQHLDVLFRSFHPSVSAFPERVVGSACALSFSRFAQRSLSLRPAHSRCHQFVTRIPKASASSLPPWLLRLLPAGAVAGWALHPLENAALSRRTPEADLDHGCQLTWPKGIACSLFDHLVGAGEQRRRHFEPECRGGLKIDHELVLGRRMHRQGGRLLACEDDTDVSLPAAANTRNPYIVGIA